MHIHSTIPLYLRPYLLLNHKCFERERKRVQGIHSNRRPVWELNGYQFYVKKQAQTYKNHWNCHGLGSNGWDVTINPSPSMSLLWENIISLVPLFSPKVRFTLGDGRSIKFWIDLLWEGTSSFLFFS